MVYGARNAKQQAAAHHCAERLEKEAEIADRSGTVGLGGGSGGVGCSEYLAKTG